MQLGSRWQVGATPHPGVPSVLHAAIASMEAEHIHGADGASWTLTWLEGRARVELLDSSAKVLADLGVAADGTVTSRAVGGRNAPEVTDAPDENDEDDDWLL